MQTEVVAQGGAELPGQRGVARGGEDLEEPAA